jgi:FkbM family methyltransferase
MPMLKQTLSRLAGNRLVQKALERNVLVSQYLMGIGAGGGVVSSGERAALDVLRRRHRAPYCIFDVGSNQGQYVKLILANMGAEALSVHCFEPGLETFKTLVSSVQTDSRIKLNNLGIGKNRGEAVLHYDNAGSGLASLTMRKLDHFGIKFTKTESVAVDTIDSYCSDHSINRIHLLKLDIEGHELDALAGASKMLGAKAIDIVTFEFGGCNIDTRSFFQDFWYFFAEVHMRIFRITASGYLFPIQSYKEIDEQFRTTNFIALKNDCLPAAHGASTANRKAARGENIMRSNHLTTGNRTPLARAMGGEA